MSVLLIVGVVIVVAVVCAACSGGDKKKSAPDFVYVIAGLREEPSSGVVAKLFGFLFVAALVVAAWYAAFVVLSLIWPYLLGVIGAVALWAFACHAMSNDT